MKRLVVAIAALAAFAPAAFAESCLIADQIDGFIDANRNSVVLTQGGEKYRAEFIGGCVGLDWAQSVATIARNSCVEAGDVLTFIDDGGSSHRCVISKLTRVAPPP